MHSSRRLLAVLLALALFTAACGGDDDETSAADDNSADVGTADDQADADVPDEPAGDADTGADADEPAVAKTQDELIAESGVALPDDFVVESATELDGEILLTGAYSADPQGPVATMTAAGWTHLGTRDGSFIMDFSFDVRTCAVVYALVSGAFATLIVFDNDDCEAYSAENASRAKDAAESTGVAAN